jgi:hypothetical protein
VSSTRKAVTGHQPPTSPEPGEAPAERFGPTHHLIVLLTVLGLGTALFATGTPMRAVFALLAGCGAIGAATVAAPGGVRRTAKVLLEAGARAAAGK